MSREYLAITALGLVIQLIGTASGEMQSPCPKVFEYVRDERTGDIEGRLEIRGVPNGVPLHITVRFSVATILPTRDVGRLELAVSKVEAIKAVQQGRPLVYRLQFPVQRPVPVVTSILFNNQEYCPTRRAIGPIVISIELEHTLFPPGVGHQSQNPSMQVLTSSNSEPQPGSNESNRSNFVSGQNLSLQQKSTLDSAPVPSEARDFLYKPMEQDIPAQSLQDQIRSPCPGVFKYIRDASTGDIQGHVEISRVPNGVPLHIRMTLSIAATLPTKYAGRLELAVSKKQAMTAIQQGRPLIYRVYFPLQYPVPAVTRILFNNQEYCTGRRATGPVVTSMELEHTLFPPEFVSQLQNPVIQDVTPSSYPKPIQASSTTNRPVPVSNSIPVSSPDLGPVQNWSFFPKPASISAPQPSESSVPITLPSLASSDTEVFSNCGRPATSDINLLISKGGRTDRGEWPWLVAIFVAKVKLEFQCGGSLISNRHVLTAAHCLTNGNRALPTSTILAVIGRHKLRAWGEKGSMISEVTEFYLHPEYMKMKGGFENDIAVITLRETVTFGKYIMPVCLWSGSVALESVVGKTGFVVGWGRDEHENPTTEEPRKITVPIVSQEECLRSNQDFVIYTSNRTLCGGARNGSGPCNGDSGGGLVMYDTENQRYQLRGVVSLSLLDRAAGTCDLKNFVVYTDAAKYLDWIKQKMTLQP